MISSYRYRQSQKSPQSELGISFHFIAFHSIEYTINWKTIPNGYSCSLVLLYCRIYILLYQCVYVCAFVLDNLSSIGSPAFGQLIINFKIVVVSTLVLYIIFYSVEFSVKTSKMLNFNRMCLFKWNNFTKNYMHSILGNYIPWYGVDV